jgi:hypothetical protein
MFEVIAFVLMLAGQLFTSPAGWVLLLVWAALLAIARSCASEYETRRFLWWSLGAVVVGAVLAAAAIGGRDFHLWLPWGAGLMATQILLLAWLVSRGASFPRMLALSAVMWVVALPAFAFGGIVVLCGATHCS